MNRNVRIILSAAMIAGAVGSLSAARAHAQGIMPADWAGYIGIGVSGVATGDLDDRLQAQGFPTFGQSAAGVNLGAYTTLKSKIMLGGEWHGLIWDEQVHENREMWLGGGYGTLGVGYAFDLSPRARIYPRLGLGVGGFGLSFDNGADSIDFDDVLADPDGQSELNPPRRPALNHMGVIADLGIGAELTSDRNGRAAMIGVRVGYLAASKSTNWWLNEHEVSGGPEASIAGAYVRVTVGVVRRR